MNEITILFEDDYCLIADKPGNMLVHHSFYARNLEDEEQSLVQRLRDQGFAAPVPVHRLDRKTSGVILLAKDKTDVKAFQQLFEEQQIRKVYLALLRGHVAESGTIESPVKNERGNYKKAFTAYRTLKHFELDIPVEPYPTARYSMVEFTPGTGRMHQLRIHANKISHPIIGDPKYGNRHHNHMFEEKLGIPNLFLHASSLEFVHPFTGEPIFVKAELPVYWEDFRV